MDIIGIRAATNEVREEMFYMQCADIFLQLGAPFLQMTCAGFRTFKRNSISFEGPFRYGQVFTLIISIQFCFVFTCFCLAVFVIVSVTGFLLLATTPIKEMNYYYRYHHHYRHAMLQGVAYVLKQGSNFEAEAHMGCRLHLKSGPIFEIN
jgi:hypothetical protein